MSALGIIIHREYMATVKTKAFMLTTILMPFAMILMMVLPTLLMSIKDKDIQKIYVIDNTGKYFKLFTSSTDYQFIQLDDNKEFNKGGEGSNALLQINGDLNTNPSGVTFLSEKQKPPRELVDYINNTLSEAVKTERLDNYTAALDVDVQVVDNLKQILTSKDQIRITTMRWDETGGTKDTVNEVVQIIGVAFTFFMFFFILMYGSIVMQSTTEEKTNRIVEVIVSSTKPFNLMMGKIIAVGLTGITQLAVWIALGTIISFIAGGFLTATSGMEAMSMGGMESQGLAEMVNSNEKVEAFLASIQSINWLKVGICFIIYFVGGYMLYASIFAMLGSAANDAQEAQQLVMPATILLILAFYVGFASMNNPEGSLAFWGSIIPFTSPIVMMVRLPYEIPWWELILSFVLLFVTAILSIKLAGKIYRTGILMYGKKTSFKELLKWMKYK